MVEEKYVSKEVNQPLKKYFKFGTSGIRAKMGDGLCELDKTAVQLITQALIDTISPSIRPYVSFVVGYDSRNYSKQFADEVVKVALGNEIGCITWDECVPSPLVAFTTKASNSLYGIMITASHNTKEYNGIKIYKSDGSLIDKKTEEKIEHNLLLDFGVKYDLYYSSDDYVNLGNIYYDEYINEVLKQSVIRTFDSNIMVAYTPLHGTGKKAVLDVLRKSGCRNVQLIEEQSEPDGDFPTVEYPDPSNRNTIETVIKLAKHLDPDIVLMTDPDADRCGVIENINGDYKPLTGNEIGVLLLDFICRNNKDKKKNTFIKTHVTTNLAKRVAQSYYINTTETNIGFKNIAENINDNFLFAFEESCGYLKGDYIKDKDGILACMLVYEMKAYWKRKGKTLHDVLRDIGNKNGFFVNVCYSIEKDMSVQEVVDSISEFLQADSVTEMIGENNCYKIYNYVAGCVVTVRKSGTENKIKVYIENFAA